MMHHRLPLATLLLAALMIHAQPGPARADDADRGDLTASFSQRVHPVLIRNDHNPLFHLVITADKPFVIVNSIAVSLEGTDDVADVEALEMFVTDGDAFTADARFGDAVTPEPSVVLRGHARLRAGANHFWLSCRLRADANLDHRVDATCTRVETSAGSIVPVDATPGVRKRIGIALRRPQDDNVHTCRIPALATTPKGTLLSVYDMRRRARRDLQEDIDIGLSRSTDGGQSWEPVRVIMDMGEHGGLPQEQNGCSDPGIVVDRNTGEIFCAAVWMNGRPGKHQWSKGGSEPGFEIGKSAQFLMVRSADDGITWTPPENMTRKLKKPEWILMAPSPQQGITLGDGTLVMPGQGRDAEDRHFSTLIVSRDHGSTWNVGSTSAAGNTECQAVELDDGSIMLNARTEHPTKFRSVWITEDLGRSWRPHETHRKALIEPNCNGSLLRFDYEENGKSKHVLLFANPHSQTGRDHHSIQVSFDEGRTWPKQFGILLDEGRGSGYPSLSRVDDGHVGIVYEGSQANLVFERIALDELLKRNP